MARNLAKSHWKECARQPPNKGLLTARNSHGCTARYKVSSYCGAVEDLVACALRALEEAPLISKKDVSWANIHFDLYLGQSCDEFPPVPPPAKFMTSGSHTHRLPVHTTIPNTGCYINHGGFRKSQEGGQRCSGERLFSAELPGVHAGQCRWHAGQAGRCLPRRVVFCQDISRHSRSVFSHLLPNFTSQNEWSPQLACAAYIRTVKF